MVFIDYIVSTTIFNFASNAVAISTKDGLSTIPIAAHTSWRLIDFNDLFD